MAEGKRKRARGKTVRPFIIGPAAARKKPSAPRARGRLRVEALRAQLRRREAEFARLLSLTERVNYGVSLDETLDFVWSDLRGVIPYNRIGFSLIDEGRQGVVARWAKSDRDVKLGKGYQGKLDGSTLARILATGRPRIINDLEGYLRRKPSSDATRLVVEEGMRSSLTCPLVVRAKPVGFMFFSSAEAGAYSDAHVEFFRQVAGMLSAVLEKGRLYTELADQKGVIERQNAVMTRDLEMAREVQRALIPKDAPRLPGFDIALVYEPAAQIGGDVLDVIPIDSRRTLLFLGDAVGHGVPAALVMSVIKASLHSAAARDPRPAAVLDVLNRTLADLLSFHFVTAACALVDRDTREAQVALAGHSPPLWFHAAAGTVSQEGDGELPLGVRRNTVYASEVRRLELGDILVFVTDGITESAGADDEQYGVERLKGCLLASGGESARGLLDAILRDVRRHAAGRTPADDQTLLVVKATA